MPVTAKLSRAFYDRFGDQIVTELVDWFNQVDLTYRTDLRELNELNFARFDAKLEQRLAEFELKIEKRLAEFELKIETRMAEFELKMETRLADFEVKMETRFAELRVEFAEFKRSVEHTLLVQARWYLATWVVQMLMLAGILFALVR